jgi:hypothetical protein
LRKSHFRQQTIGTSAELPRFTLFSIQLAYLVLPLRASAIGPTPAPCDHRVPIGQP